MDNKEKSNTSISDVLKYFWLAIKPQKWLFLFVMLAVSVANTLRLVTPLYYKKFFDLLAIDSGKIALSSQLVNLILIILAINVIRWLAYRSGGLTLNKSQSESIARLKQMAFDYLIKHSYSFFSNSFAGALVQKVNRFGRAFERLYDTMLFDIIPLIIDVSVVITVIYFENHMMSLVLIVWAILISVFGFYFSRWKLKYDLQSAEADSATTALLADNISNQNTIASFAAFIKEQTSFKKTSVDLAKKQRLAWNLSEISNAVQAGMIIIVEFMVFYYAIRFWQKDLVTLGTFVLLQAYVLMLGNRLWDINRVIRNTYEGFADSKEMVDILKTPYEVRDIPTATKLSIEKGEIEFKNVTFAFNETRNVLESINLKINTGEKIALIGPSGAGKSTLVKLLLRMYDVVEGIVMIDNQNIQKVTQDSLRKQIALVPQDPILFHRTLMENIRYGKEDATDEEVFEAARLAHCDKFIENLPLKYETYVGERGIKLSGGERQRVAIARAILKNAPILILDEATSSLDSQSELLIQDALDKLMYGKTSIVIAHRLSTIRKMDRVVVIDGGKITEEGNHEELLQNENSLYKKLWNLQAGGFLPE